MEDKTLFIFDAEEGMVLSKDVILADGHILTTKGTTLDLDLIAKISESHVLEITVIDTSSDEEIDKALDEPDIPDEKNYFDQLRSTPEFKKFNKYYLSNIDSVKNNLNDIVTSNAPIDTEALLHGTSKIISEFTNSLQLFDMLHSMRQFDDLTYVHCVNVALIASIIGKWVGYSEKDIKVLILSGLLHDIGKLLTPTEILTKPGKLTGNEFEIMKKHVNLGYEQLKSQNIDTRIKEACLLHHERCDGTGYPFHITSERIPPVAKIISIADVYDAMTATRVYRGSICPFKVIDIMMADAYTRFDPKYLLPFLKNVVSSYIHNNVRLSDGKVGKVVLINDRTPSRPIVQLNETKFIDLSKETKLEIVAIL